MALAITNFSPRIWVSILIYGVSPHPAQAPENANNGFSNATPLIVVFGSGFTLFTPSKSILVFSTFSTIFKAFLPIFSGQTLAHTPQPVQSFSLIFIEYLSPSWPINGMPSTSSSFAMALMTACGQAKAHIPHSIQFSDSHFGTMFEIFLFSLFVVAPGKRPKA